MSKLARILSQGGLYHILFMGINRQNLFEEEQDYERMLEIIKEVKEIGNMSRNDRNVMLMKL